MGAFKVTTIQDTAGANSSTTAQIYSGIVRAWVNFNGTGTVAIRASYNVTSITDNGGNGNYTINWTSGALPNSNYAVSGLPSGGTDRMITIQTLTNYTTSVCQIQIRGGAGGTADVDMVSMAAFSQ
jgi:hypothetical protein